MSFPRSRSTSRLRQSRGQLEDLKPSRSRNHDATRNRKQVMLLSMFMAALSLEFLFVGGLLFSIRQGKRRAEILLKTGASLVFLVFGISLLPGNPSSSDLFITAGLFAAFAGDLILLRKSGFLAGLGAFLGCHLSYILAFNRLKPLPEPSIALFVFAGAITIGLWLRPYCRHLLIPVSLYVGTIALMLTWAVSAADAGAIPLRGALGAVLFFLSDILVARQRFVQPQFLNRAMGLPLYYAAQLLLASLISRI